MSHATANKNLKSLKDNLSGKSEKFEHTSDDTTSKVTKQELMEKEYQETLNKKKLQQEAEEKKYKNITVRIAKEETILCLAIDGSINSREAFDILATEFLNRLKNSVLICPHIYDENLDSQFNWRFQKSNVIDYYKNKILSMLSDYQGYLIIQDRDTNKCHEIEQAYKIAELNECKYFFCAFEGLREQKLKKSRIDIGLEFLLKESRIPIFIMKDNKKRGVHNKGYKWLLVMDRSLSDAIKVFDLFLPVIDFELDTIQGLTLLPSYISKDDVKDSFYKKMEEIGFVENKNFTYMCQSYVNKQSEWLTDYINHNDVDFFDFVIFLNNPQKSKSQGEDCETFKFLKNICANLCFCNYGSIYGYDRKELSKKPTDNDERVYLKKLHEIASHNENKEEDSDKNKEKEKEKDEMNSEVYGVRKGHVFNPSGAK